MDYKNVLHRLPAYSLETPMKRPTTGEFMAVAKGQRLLAWFTYHRRKNICFVVNPWTKSIVPSVASFSSDLSLGTLLSGVIVNKVFIADDIFHLKGNPVRSMDALRAVMELLGQVRLLPKQLIFQMAETSYTPFVVTPYPQQGLKSLAPLAQYPPNEVATFVLTSTDQKDIYAADVEILVDTLERSKFLANLFHTCPRIPFVCQFHPIHQKWVPMFTS